jgi:hypothetical protein
MLCRLWERWKVVVRKIGDVQSRFLLWGFYFVMTCPLRHSRYNATIVCNSADRAIPIGCPRRTRAGPLGECWEAVLMDFAASLAASMMHRRPCCVPGMSSRQQRKHALHEGSMTTASPYMPFSSASRKGGLLGQKWTTWPALENPS